MASEAERAKARERHAERMATDPEYRERRRKNSERWRLNNEYEISEDAKERYALQQKLRYAERTENDPEFREKSRQYKAKARQKSEARRAVDPEYDEKCRETLSQYHQRKMAEDPEYVEKRRRHAREYNARQREERPEHVRMLKRKHHGTRRARKLDQFVEEVDPLVVFERDSGVCGICQEKIDGDFHVDHIIPLSKGGEHSYANVQAAHPRCNCIKKDRWPISVESKNS